MRVRIGVALAWLMLTGQNVLVMTMRSVFDPHGINGGGGGRPLNPGASDWDAKQILEPQEDNNIHNFGDGLLETKQKAYDTELVSSNVEGDASTQDVVQRDESKPLGKRHVDAPGAAQQ